MNQPYQHVMSACVVSDILNCDILDRASRLSMPRQLVYQQCCNITQNIHKSIVGINQVHPDQYQTQLYTDQQIRKSPLDKKIRKIPSYSPQSHIPLISCQENPISRRQIQFSQKNLRSENRIPINSSNTKLKSQLEIKLSHKKLLPCINSHQCDPKYDNGARVKMKKNTLLKNQEKVDQDIKILRQNKLHSNLSFGYSIERHLTIKKDQIKKIKQNQSKKCLVISTNYQGQIVPLNKNEINRQIPHYIDIQIGLLEQDSQANKIKLNSCTTQKQNGLSRQFSNYKQIKMTERQDKFTSNVIRKVNEVKMPKRILDQADFLQQCTNKQDKQSPLKFIGKNSKPVRVGFRLFERLKKKIHELSNSKQQIKSQNTNMTASLVKKSCQKKKQSVKSIQFSSVHQSTYEKQIKKKQNVCLGNYSAVNFLLNEFRKCKKTVKINEQFL